MKQIEWQENGTGYLMRYGHWSANASINGYIWLIKLYHCKHLHATAFGDTLDYIKIWLEKELDRHEEDCAQDTCGCKEHPNFN